MRSSVPAAPREHIKRRAGKQITQVVSILIEALDWTLLTHVVIGVGFRTHAADYESARSNASIARLMQGNAPSSRRCRKLTLFGALSACCATP